MIVFLTSVRQRAVSVSGRVCYFATPANYSKRTTDVGVNTVCDLNGDGVINIADVAIIRDADNYGKIVEDQIFPY